MTKPKVRPEKFFQYRLESLHADFNKAADDFRLMMDSGAGIFSTDMESTLRRLNFLYVRIACHTEAAKIAGVDPSKLTLPKKPQKV
jgi:hypothetical protein